MHELFDCEMDETGVFVNNLYDWATNFHYAEIPKEPAASFWSVHVDAPSLLYFLNHEGRWSACDPSKGLPVPFPCAKGSPTC